MCSDSERRQPRLAEANKDSSRISLLRCMVMSDRSSSGKSFSSCGDDEWGQKRNVRVENKREVVRVKRDSCENTLLLGNGLFRLHCFKNTVCMGPKYTHAMWSCPEIKIKKCDEAYKG